MQVTGYEDTIWEDSNMKTKLIATNEAIEQQQKYQEHFNKLKELEKLEIEAEWDLETQLYEQRRAEINEKTGDLSKFTSVLEELNSNLPILII